MAGGEKPRKIIFEGVDGCGKDTLAKMVVEHLEDRGIKAILSPEPNRTTETGKLIDACLGGRASLDPVALQLLFMANRAEILVEEEKIAREGAWIIKPRSFLSTAAHMHILPVEYVVKAHRHMLSRAEDFDLVCWLRISPEVALERLKNSGRQMELFEELPKMELTDQRYSMAIGYYAHKSVILYSGKSGPEKLLNSVIDNLKIRNWIQ